MKRKLKPIAKALTGAQILNSLRRGHMVRRKCWQNNYFIRICNEQGYDEQGRANLGRRSNAIFTLATSGYFLHLGYSSQPFRVPRVWKYSGTSTYEEASRDGEGIAMLFAEDWEDYGFISSEEFEELTKELKDSIRKDHKRLVEQAIKRAKSRESAT